MNEIRTVTSDDTLLACTRAGCGAVMLEAGRAAHEAGHADDDDAAIYWSEVASAARARQ